MFQFQTYVVRNSYENIKWAGMAPIFQLKNKHKETSWIF